MNTLARYRKCFEACAVKLPDGFELDGAGPEVWVQGPENILDTHAALCVCRMTAMEELLESYDYFGMCDGEILLSNDRFVGCRGFEGPTLDAALQAALRARKEQ